jgi:hypothetical protein
MAAAWVENWIPDYLVKYSNMQNGEKKVVWDARVK